MKLFQLLYFTWLLNFLKTTEGLENDKILNETDGWNSNFFFHFGNEDYSDSEAARNLEIGINLEKITTLTPHTGDGGDGNHDQENKYIVTSSNYYSNTRGHTSAKPTNNDKLTSKSKKIISSYMSPYTPHRQPLYTTTNEAEKLKNLIINLNNKLVTSPYKTSKVPVIKNFTKHLYGKVTELFENLKTKVTNIAKLNFIYRSYKQKFREYVKDIQNVTISDNIRTQMLLLNILRTSQNILKRLAQYVRTHPDTTNSSGRHPEVTNTVIIKAIENEIIRVDEDVCKTYNVCKNNTEFGDFIGRIIDYLLVAGGEKLHLAVAKYSVVLRQVNLSEYLTEELNEHIIKHAQFAINYTDRLIRTLLVITKTLIASRNVLQLSNIDHSLTNVENKTHAVLDLLYIFEDYIQGSDEIKEKWSAIEANSQQLVDGDIDETLTEETIFALANHIKNDGFAKMSQSHLEVVRSELLKLLH